MFAASSRNRLSTLPRTRLSPANSLLARSAVVSLPPYHQTLWEMAANYDFYPLDTHNGTPAQSIFGP